MPSPTGFSDAPLGGLALNDPLPRWWWAVTGRLAELTRLPRGWDGYDGRPVSVEHATTALRLIERLLPTATGRVVAPDIVPGASGDLQVEWHSPSFDLEIHVLDPDHMAIWLKQPSREDEFYALDDATFGHVALCLERLMAEYVAAVAEAT